MRDTPAARKRIVIVEDEQANREMLGRVLEQQYEILYAATGEEGLDQIRGEASSLSLVLLDLNLPDMYGMEIIRILEEEGILAHLPVIVFTADRDAEVESLTGGAMDFIPKPYPRPEVILARVRRTIELSEDRALIGQTERDPLTGLYNREYFYSYCDQYDRIHKNESMDAVAININHFRMVNERYGKAYGDEVLRRIADRIQRAVERIGGMACRRESDTFLVYCPHGGDYIGMLDAISEGIAGEGKTENVVRLRMGVYPGVDRSIDIDRRFDRAKLAADSARSSYAKAVAVYDNDLHESEMFAEQLLVDFPKAVEEGQFSIYYQPKYDIRGEEPVLSSAEALVRWNHPEYGIISPGVFVPLFESNGLIRKLDNYVWHAAAAQIRDWQDRLSISIPVSVNVSRVDMHDLSLTDSMTGLIRKYGIGHNALMLEVTESAYTEDSSQIIRAVESLRRAGFYIEMDDFGTGYSSLSMLTNLPIDALKLDMEFIRSAFQNGKNTRMLEFVIQLAESLNVPVIAEGVETAEQLFTLKAMGCDMVQGFYFSQPVPPEIFETFLLDKKERSQLPVTDRKLRRKLSHDKFTYDAMHDPLTGLYNQSAFDLLLYDADKDHAALLLARLDGYAELLEKEGQEAADRAVKRVADALRDSFRSTDFVFRFREDEFVVILTRVTSSQRDVIFDKVLGACKELQESHDGLPAVRLNVGLAFGDRENPSGDIFQDADTALERAKAARQSGCAIY